MEAVFQEKIWKLYDLENLVFCVAVQENEKASPIVALENSKKNILFQKQMKPIRSLMGRE